MLPPPLRHMLYMFHFTLLLMLDYAITLIFRLLAPAFLRLHADEI